LKVVLVLLIALILSLNILIWNEFIVYSSFIAVLLIILFKDFLYEKIINASLLLNPYYFFTIFFILYFSVGCVNLSTYRGVMNAGTVLSIIMAYIAFIGGAKLGSWIKVKRNPVHLDRKRLKTGTIFLLLCSMAAAAYVTLKYGVIILHPSERFYVPTTLIYFVLLAIIPPLVYFTYAQFNEIKITRMAALSYMALPFCIIATSGYRGHLMIMLLTVGIVAYLLSRGPGRVKMFVYLIVALLILSAGFYIRRDISTRLMQTEDLFARYDFNKKYLAVGSLHFASRETIGLYQKIVEIVPSKIDYGQGKLFFSDFMTILPGKQMSGGVLIYQITTGQDESAFGLTPSALGGLYFDFGYMGIFIGFGVMGILASYFYKKYQVNQDVPSIANLSFVYVILMHYIHRGILAPYYLFLFVIMNILLFFSRSREEIRETKVIT